jgi:uncharacterized SAM-binding protein YcdF (DUF218 family)
MKASPKIRSLQTVLKALGFVALAVGLFLAILCAGIVRQARHPEVRPAAAIVVFGAAQYAGHPSPVYRARLDHAYDLFHRGLAPVVITTGGAGGDPNFNEGGVGRDYLIERGIPDRNLIAETQGTDTAESADRVAVIMHTNGMKTCLAVSDEYHVFRIKKLLETDGITAYAAPRPDSRPRSWLERGLAIIREALSFTLWKLHLT